jgi:bifunctional UDP-N-acetylglucosamine pyrophosphorylase/glucosamine-1-phosphate N-acetyltransferase
VGNAPKFDVIIPTVQQNSGILGYFQSAPLLALLPLGHKTGIEYVLDDLAKQPVKEYVNRVYLACAAEHEGVYRDILGRRPGRDVKFVPIPQFSPQGIVYPVQHVVERIRRDDLIPEDQPLHNPVMLVFGDTLLHDRYWKFFLSQCAKLEDERPGSPWVLLSFGADATGAGPVPSGAKGPALLPQNRKSLCFLPASAPVLSSLPAGPRGAVRLVHVDARDAADFVDVPLFPAISARKHVCSPDYLTLQSIGVIAASPKAWDTLCSIREKTRHAFRLWRFYGLLRVALVRGDVDCHLVYASPETSEASSPYWYDINYPWEYLQAGRLLRRGIQHFYSAEGPTPDHPDPDMPNVGPDHPDLEGYEVEIVLGRHGQFGAFRLNPNVRHARFVSDSDQWLSPKAELRGAIIKPTGKTSICVADGALIEGVCVLGEGCRVMEHASVRDSVLGEGVVIGAKSMVEESVILRGSQVFPFSAISHSVIGEDVVIGGHVHVAYSKLPNLPDMASAELRGHRTVNERYQTEVGVVRHRHRFGCVVGDGARLGMGVLIEPGRKVGAQAQVAPQVNVVRTVPPGSRVERRRDR